MVVSSQGRSGSVEGCSGVGVFEAIVTLLLIISGEVHFEGRRRSNSSFSDDGSASAQNNRLELVNIDYLERAT